MPSKENYDPNSLIDALHTARPGKLSDDYVPPTSFSVGEKSLDKPFVDIRDLKAHLCLLRAFKNLRNAVESMQSAPTKRWPQQVLEMEPETRWAWFVGIAVDKCVLHAHWRREIPG